MHRILIALLLIASPFAENEYPYFGDMKIQLEFEEGKIIINEVDEKEMYISGGGSKFNWLSLLNPVMDSYLQEPIYINTDTETSYRYIYTFEIIQNGKKIAELEFLQVVGLSERFDKIVAEYNSEVDKYNKVVENNQPYEITKKEYDKSKHIVQNKAEYRFGKMLKFFNWCSMGYFSIWATHSMVLLVDPPNDNKDLQSHYIKSGAITTVAFLSNVYIKRVLDRKYERTVINKINIPKPKLKQTLTSAQLTSLAESYNRQLYNEIKNK